jgi:hypothetical protein
MDPINLSDVRIDFDATCEKAWQDDKGKMHVRAVASDDRIDLQRDRMSQKALEKMAKSAKDGVPFLETHRSVFEFGRTVGGEILEREQDGKKVRQLVVDVELDGDYPQARKLFKEVAAGNCKRQLSIGGKLNLKNREAVSIEMTQNGLARTINDLDLDHIASTREKQAANPRTSFVEAISKALDDAEKAGWTHEVEPPPVASPEPVTDDMKAGMGVLASLGRAFKDMFGGAREMKKETPPETAVTTPESNPVTETESAPATEAAEKAKTVAAPKVPAPETAPKNQEHPVHVCPEKAAECACPEKAVATPRNTETPKTPKTMAEQEGLKPAAAKCGKATAEDLARDIAVLLSKKGYTTPSTEEEELDETETESPEKNLFNLLWTTRYELAKQAAQNPQADHGSDETAPASQIVAGGPYAPLSGAKGLAPGKMYIPDKAPKGDSTDVGTSGVTDHRRNIQTGGEIETTAPTAKDAMDATMRNLTETSRLPQASEVSQFGKSLDEGLEVVLHKSVEVTKDLVLAAVEKVMEEQSKGLDQVNKSVEGIGSMVNESIRRLAEMEARMNRVEKTGGVSHSGPRGSDDSTVAHPKGRVGMWQGLFNKAASEALSKY